MKRILFLSLTFILCLIPVLSLFHPGLPKTHDGQDHVARIANFYLNLSQGNLIPRWAPNLNWGYGHPILEFLYPLPSYISSIFHSIGFSFVDSTKIVFGLGMILSFIFMYLWMKMFLPKTASILGAFLYTYAPYRFVELYVRGDVGENLAFAFVPLVLFFIYRFYKNKNTSDILLGAISLGLLILSHNAISLMFSPLVFLYCVYLAFIAKDKKIFVNLLSLIILGFGLAAFFWIPALLEGKYTLRNIVTKGGYISRFVDFKNLIFSPWSYGSSGEFTVQLGVIQWLSLILSPLLFYKFFRARDKNMWLILGLFFITCAAIFLMLPISNVFWQRIMLLQNFQFPWRFLAITIFTTAVLGAFLIKFTPGKLRIWLTAILIIIVLIISKDYIKPQSYLFKPESFYSGIYNSTTDTGESSPIWSVRFMEKTPKAHIEVIDGKAAIKELERSATYHSYQILVSKRSLFKENTLYFPGWEIKANNIPLNIQFQNMQYRGIMLFYLDKGNYVVQVRYSETRLRLISDVLSFASLFTIFVFIIIKFVKRRIY